MGCTSSEPTNEDAISLRAAAGRGDIAIVSSLLRKYPVLVNLTDHVRDIYYTVDYAVFRL